jgi:hypothetical protein
LLPVRGKSVSIPLIQAGGISARNDAALNVKETFTVDVVRGDRRNAQRTAVTNASGGGRDFTKPVDFIGTKTFGSVASYEAYAAQYLYTVTIPGCGTPGRMFVGQRKDPSLSTSEARSTSSAWTVAASGGTDDIATERHRALSGADRVPRAG